MASAIIHAASRRVSSRALCALSLLFGAVSATPFNAHAQSKPNGSISGRVVGADQAPLTNAVVTVTDLAVSTRTSASGNYALRDLPAGPHTLRVAMLGHAPREFAVRVTAGENLIQSVVLERSALELEGVKVSAILEGQGRALLDQKQSDNIKTVLSADGIGRFPDLILSDALSRVSGVSLVRFRGEGTGIQIRGAPPEFSAVAINGLTLPTATDARETNLNAFRPDIVSSVEVIKALTPDMDASSIGGRVNIKTRGGLTAGKRVIQATPALGYAELGEERKNYDGAVSYSDVFGAKRNVGVLLSYGRSRIARVLDNLENTWTFSPAVNDFRPSTASTKAYNIDRTRESYSARFDFGQTERANFFVSGTQQSLDNKEERHNTIFNFADALRFSAGSNATSGIADQFTVRSNYHDRRNLTTTRQLSAGGTYQFGLGTLDVTGAVSRADASIPPGRMYAEFRTPATTANRVSMAYDYSKPDFPVLGRVTPVTLAPISGGSLTVNPSQYAYYEFNSREDTFRDEQKTLAMNFNMPTSVLSYPTTFKVGAKMDLASRDRTYRLYRSRSETSAPTYQSLLGERVNNNFGLYDYGLRYDNAKVRAAEANIKNRVLVNASSYPLEYVVSENIYGAYAMQTTDIGRLRLVGGLRTEMSQASGDGYITRDNWVTFKNGSTSRNNLHLFPSLHANFRATPDFVLRAAFTTGIIRPSMSNMRPSGGINEAASTPTFSGSNPSIRPATSRGFDLMAEYYVPLGVISGGAFYKRLKDVAYTVGRQGTAADSIGDISLRGFNISRPENSDKGQLYGFEVNLDRPLTFLPGPLSSLGLLTNYTYTKSKATVPFSTVEVPLANQAAHSANVSGYFDRWGLNMRLSYNYQSTYLQELNSTDQRLNIYFGGRGILDYSSTFDVRPNVALYVQATNLTNSVARRYRGEVTRVEELEQFGRQVLGGLRLTF